MGKLCWVPGFLGKIRRRKRCVGHSSWTSSNPWRETRWSRLWEFIGHLSNVCQQENPTVHCWWPDPVDCLKNVVKHKRLYNGEVLLGVWMSPTNRKRKCCVGHSSSTSSNRWRETRWSRLWEFIGHRSNAKNQQENPTVHCRWLAPVPLDVDKSLRKTRLVWRALEPSP